MEGTNHVIVRDAVVIDEGGGYFMRGTRVDIGAFSIVVIEVMHPNYGYFSDYMIWVNSLHVEKWKSIPIFRGSEEFTLEEFLSKHPEFKPLFRKRDPAEVVFGN